jgi:hypothetical protein
MVPAIGGRLPTSNKKRLSKGMSKMESCIVVDAPCLCSPWEKIHGKEMCLASLLSHEAWSLFGLLAVFCSSSGGISSRSHCREKTAYKPQQQCLEYDTFKSRQLLQVELVSYQKMNLKFITYSKGILRIKTSPRAKATGASNLHHAVKSGSASHIEHNFLVWFHAKHPSLRLSYFSAQSVLSGRGYEFVDLSANYDLGST